MPKAKKQEPDQPVEPVFAEHIPTEDPTKNKVHHASDKEHYLEVNRHVQPIPAPEDPHNLVLPLEKVYGRSGKAIVDGIKEAGQIVFQAGGDSGPTVGPKSIEEVVNKLILDFDEKETGAAPVFFFHLGDIVYSFGESVYYYDQFYEPFRDYPAPVLAIPGNHDGLSYKGDREEYMAAFKRNFVSPHPTNSPDAGGLSRTTMIQPGVYFALDAPFVSILGLYSNTLEDPGVISSENGKIPGVTDEQLDFLKTQLARLKEEQKCAIIAVHHPPFAYGGSHGGSPKMLADIDQCCADAGYWPHAVISGHAHNYQRFSRTVPKSVTKDTDYEIPYIVCGNSGHHLSKLGRKGEVIRAPKALSKQLIFENYDDMNYGYLRVICNDEMLRIEYHDVEPAQKTYSDAVTVMLKTRTIEAN